MISAPLSDRVRHSLARVFRQVLSEESELAATTRNYAWRVQGSPLQSLKRLFQEQGRQVDRWLAMLSAEAEAIGVTAFAPAEREPGGTGEGDDPKAAPRVAIHELLGRHERIAGELRSAVEDLCRRNVDRTTTAVLDRLLEFHETSAWMLRLLLENPEPARI